MTDTMDRKYFADEAQLDPEFELSRLRIQGFLWFSLGILIVTYIHISLTFSKTINKFLAAYDLIDLAITYNCVALVCHCALVCALYVSCRYLPYCPIGSQFKLGMDVITVCLALLLRWCLSFDFKCLNLLVSFTIEIHTIGQLLRAASDFYIWDMLVEILMEFVVYLTATSIHIFPVVLLSCVAVIFCRFYFYPSPQLSPKEHGV